MKTFTRTRIVLVATAAFCLAVWVSASAQPSFELGVKAGLAFTKLVGDDTKGVVVYYEPEIDAVIEADIGDLKIGFVGGAYAAAHITDQFGVRLEALYFKKGGKGDISGEMDIPGFGLVNLSGETTVTLDYFEIPLLGVLSFPVGETATFDVFAGPALAFNTKAEQEVEITASGGGISETVSEKGDIEEVKSADFGGVLGAGLTFNLSQVSIFAEARWTYGFTTVDDSPEEADIRNSAFGIMAGVAIPLAKTP